jgi:hypothetical protein
MLRHRDQGNEVELPCKSDLRLELPLQAGLDCRVPSEPVLL